MFTVIQDTKNDIVGLGDMFEVNYLRKGKKFKISAEGGEKISPPPPYVQCSHISYAAVYRYTIAIRRVDQTPYKHVHH